MHLYPYFRNGETEAQLIMGLSQIITARARGRNGILILTTVTNTVTQRSRG